jgi:dihydroorotase-like cyclic amidohydrolase
MPLNAIPPTTTVENLNIKVEASRGKCWVDVGFYGGIIPGNDKDLKGLVDAGVRGFKGFLCDSGVCVPPPDNLTCESLTFNRSKSFQPSPLSISRRPFLS